MTSPDLTFKISADLAEVKAAIASMRAQFAELGRGVTADGLSASIDSTAAAAARAEKAAKRVADTQVREAKRAAAGQADAAEKGAQAQDAAAERQRRRSEATAERERRRQAASDELARRQKAAAERRAADEAERQRQKAANFDKNLQRQLAPQLTDIGVGLATGQSPLMVLLQQGGQLKDLFGGIVPAVKAVGGAVVGLVNPLTLSAAGVAALAIAYTKGADESLRFNRINIETGNQAGVTTDRLVGMARDMDQAFGVTVSSASDTLAEVVQSGKFATNQIGLVAEAAETLRNTTGKAVGTTIAEFAKIADDPVKGAVELNRQYNFLTGSTLAQIRALQQQGRTQDAANLATKAYADALKQRTPEIEKNLGLIERGWLAVKRGAKEAASAALEVGRPQTGRDQFNDLVAERQKLQDKLDTGKGMFGQDLSDREKASIQRQIETRNAQLQTLANAEADAQKKANADAARGRAVALQDAVTTEAEQYLTAGQRRQKLIEQITNRTAQGIADAQTAGDAAAQAEVERARKAILDGLGREAAKSQAAVISIDAGLVRDSTDRALLELDRLYDKGEIKLSDFLDRKAALQKQAIDAEIRAAKAERAAAAEPEDIARANASIEKLQRQRARVDKDVAFERRNAERQVSDDIIELRAQQLEEEGRLEEAAALRFERQYRELRKRLATEGNTEGVALLDALQKAQTEKLRRQTGDEVVNLRAQQLEAEGKLEQAAILRLEVQYRDLRKRLAGDAESLALVDKIVDIERARARFNELQTLAEQASANAARRQAEITDQVRSGALTPEQGRAEEQIARQQQIDSLRAVSDEMLRLAEITKDPQTVEAANRIRDAIKGIGQEGAPEIQKVAGDLRLALAEMDKNFARSAVNSGVDAITGLFTDLASGSKSAGDAIKDFARNFALSMIQIAARALATFLVLQLLDTLFPGAGKLVAASGNIGAGVKHGGGMVGHGMRRNVSPLAFIGAPRFHNGSGVLGLKPDEVPAILQTGERVQSRAEVAASKQGGGGGNGYRIVNVLDPSLVSGFLESAAGERAILNVIQRNPAQVRQTIGQ